MTKGFLSRHGLSFRSPHLRRRAEPNDSLVASLIAEFDVALTQSPKELIYKIDETFSRTVSGELRILTRKGADNVSVTLKSPSR